MKKFDHVEDYIEIIAGARNPQTNKLTQTFLFGWSPILSLARYDNDVLESMCNQSLGNIALTERQGDLAVKIILKYQRQFASHGVDVGPLIDSPKFRLPLRKMDYSQRLSLADDKLVLKFPYNNSFIEHIRQFVKESQGCVQWKKDSKVWELALTEYNLNWAYMWASLNKFEIDPEVTRLFEMVAEVEKNPYKIELTVNNDTLEIVNAPDSLVDYINEHVGGLNADNLIRLVDMSSILGFTVDPEITSVLASEFGHRFVNLATSRELKINPGSMLENDDFSSVLEYAIKCNRLPVVIYEPDLSNRMLNKLKSLYPADYILEAGSSKDIQISEAIKFVHTYKPLRNLETIPLIISSAGMVFGGDKQLMIQSAEKVVYCASDVYNKNQTGRKVKGIGS